MTLVNRALPADRALLWDLERHAPGLHIAGLLRLEGELRPRDLLDRLERLRPLPRLGLRIDRPAFGAARWRAGTFEPERHLHVATDDDPETAVARALRRPLDPGRPLWEVHLLPGYDERGDAVFVKAHLAVVDGLGTKELFGTLLGSSETAAVRRVRPRRGDVDGNGMSTGASRRVDTRVAEWLEDWTRTGQETLAGVRELASDDARTAMLTLSEVMPDIGLPPAPLPFNRADSGRRRLIRAELSYADVRAVRGRLGGTVSDVVLAVVGGALASYLEAHSVSTRGRRLRIALATDLPGGGERRRSLLPIEVPLGVGAAERFAATRHLARLLKAAGIANTLSRLTGPGRAAGPVAAAVAALGSRFRAPFHLTVADANGPQIPQYLAGRRVIGYTPSWPIGLRQGLSCAFLAYNQLLHVGLTVDDRACPDATLLPRLFAESLDELRSAAGGTRRPPVPAKPSRPEATSIQET